MNLILAQFSLYVHKGGLKPDLFHFPTICYACTPIIQQPTTLRYHQETPQIVHELSSNKMVTGTILRGKFSHIFSKTAFSSLSIDV